MKKSSHPLNLLMRFLLELAALAAMAVWGWSAAWDWKRIVLAAGIPVIAAVVWGTFAVPDDPSRSGKAPVPVPGVIRLLVELIIFGLATWMLIDLGYRLPGGIFGFIVLAHYLLSYDRVYWLIKGRKT